MDYRKENSKIWDHLAEMNNVWSVPVTSETIAQARNGIWSIVLTPTKPVPRAWFPERLDNKKSSVWHAEEGSRGRFLRRLAQK